MRSRIEFWAWTQEQVRALRRLNYELADKDVARVWVELHNKGLFAAGSCSSARSPAWRG